MLELAATAEAGSSAKLEYVMVVDTLPATLLCLLTNVAGGLDPAVGLAADITEALRPLTVARNPVSAFIAPVTGLMGESEALNLRLYELAGDVGVPFGP